MSFQIGTAGLGIDFTGDLGNLLRTLDQGAGAVEQFGSRSSNAFKAAQAVGDDMARGFNRAGVSAAQMQAAMRGVPAQFTDIVTSLQAGQNPMTVFLQQGGQLKDMFGGVGPAAQAMGAYLAGLVNPLTLGAGAIAAFGVAAYQGASELQALNKTLILSGNTAGVTADQLMDMAASIDAMGEDVSQSNAAAALEEMVKAGVRGEAQLKRYAKAAAEFEAVGGSAAKEVAKNFEALGRDPVGASAKLTASMGYLTSATYDQIKALVDQGKTVEAARVAQEAYSSAIEVRTPALLQNLGSIERGWLAIKNGAAEAWKAMLNVGRGDSLAQEIAAAEKRVAQMSANAPKTGGWLAAQGRKKLADERAALEALREQQRVRRVATDQTSERAQRDQDAIAAEQNKATKGNKGGGSHALRQDEFAAVLGRLTAKDAGIDPSFNRDLETLYKGYQKGRIGVEDYRLAVDRLITTQGFYKKQVEEEESANKAAARSLEDNIRATERAAETAMNNARAMRGELETMGMSELQLHELAQSRLADSAASLRQRAAIMENIDLSGRASDALRAEADALEDLAKSKDAVYSKRAVLSSDETIAEAARINGKAADNFSTSLADSISQGILEGSRRGTAIMDVFRAELQAQFAKTVLRPAVQPVADGMSSAIGGLMNGLLSAFGAGATGSGYNPGADMGFSSSAWEQFTPSAKGNVFAGPGISAYSSTVVDRPTVFPFAKGIGLMGEAGAEAIMPLRRGSDGRLGVAAAGAGGAAVTVNVINQAGAEVSTSSRTGSDGEQIIEVLVARTKASIAGDFANRSGDVSRGLEAGYGIRPAMS